MFRTLSSRTRREMLKVLAREEIHISGLAARLGISVPVAAKHVKLLEEKGLLTRKRFGRTHVLKANLERMYEALDEFSESTDVVVPPGSSMLDALKKVSGVKVEKLSEREFVTSIDGEQGYYIYEVDGKLPDLPMESYELKQDVRMKLKKFVPVSRKEISIRLR